MVWQKCSTPEQSKSVLGILSRHQHTWWMALTFSSPNDFLCFSIFQFSIGFSSATAPCTHKTFNANALSLKCSINIEWEKNKLLSLNEHVRFILPEAGAGQRKKCNLQSAFNFGRAMMENELNLIYVCERRQIVCSCKDAERRKWIFMCDVISRSDLKWWARSKRFFQAKDSQQWSQRNEVVILVFPGFSTALQES